MDLLEVCKKQFLWMVQQTNHSKLKIFLMDGETNYTIKLAGVDRLSKSGVAIFDNISNVSDKMDLVAVVFISSTASSIKWLQEELRSPHFIEYHLNFNDVIHSSIKSGITKCDKFSLIRSINTHNMNLFPLNKILFTAIDCNDVNSLTSLFMIMKRVPIMHHDKSESSQRFCDELYRRISYLQEQDQLKSNIPSVTHLVIIDRSFDAIAPLLTPWTYKSMIHDLLTMDAPTDAFYSMVCNDPFDVVCNKLVEYIETYKSKFQLDKTKLKTTADIDNFIITYPAERESMAIIAQHMDIRDSLMKIINANELYDVIQCEQMIATKTSSNSVNPLMDTFVAKSTIGIYYRIKLVHLHLLVYADKVHAIKWINLLILELANTNNPKVQLKKTLINMMNKCSNMPNQFLKLNTKAIFSSVTDVMGHKSEYDYRILHILDDLHKKKFVNYPLYYPATPSSLMQIDNIIIYVIGGTTYEEFNALNAHALMMGINVVLGSTEIIKSSSLNL
jgi:vacuolar protein sorting-associated protein 45